MLFISLFALSWAIWFLFADKKRWRELFPVSVFAALLGCLTDTITHHYKLWEYQTEMPLLQNILDDFGIYMVVPYLFIQLLPKRRTLLTMLAYWAFWTGFSIGLEYLHLITNHMRHLLWWNLWYSYAADWLLFWLFYKYHSILKLSRLSREEVF